jgi:hypothetical protein
MGICRSAPDGWVGNQHPLMWAVPSPAIKKTALERVKILLCQIQIKIGWSTIQLPMMVQKTDELAQSLQSVYFEFHDRDTNLENGSL